MAYKVSINVDAEVSITCGTCGADLSNTSDGNGNEITVAPCETCLKEQYDKGHDEGYDEAQ